MDKKYHCCICNKSIDKGKRFVYQEYDGKKPYGAFHSKKTYDICDKCFMVFMILISRPDNKELEKEKLYERKI